MRRSFLAVAMVAFCLPLRLATFAWNLESRESGSQLMG
jgi:hypothetical protein